MSQDASRSTENQPLDVQKSSQAQDHRRVLETYTALNIGDSMLVRIDDDPSALRTVLARELAGAFEWQQLCTIEHGVQVRITKRASTALPRIVADTTDLFAATLDETAGSVWQLAPGARDLDANIIVLKPRDEIAKHVGPALDVLVVVLEGSGALETELTTTQLQHGAVVWLPQKAERRFIAGAHGLKYFTVHQRKPTLNISAPPDR